MNEIERKFLIPEIPNIPILKGYTSERYLLESDKGTEERITHIGGKYYYEQKQVISELERTRDKQEISESEFNELKSRAYGALKRETLLINEQPRTVIQSYKDKYAGLIRVEVEFENQIEAENFRPYDWLGREITGTRIARDSTLASMSRNEVLAQIGS